MIFTVPVRSIMMFSGRRSWCSISSRWKACRPRAICWAMPRTVSTSGAGLSAIHCASVIPSTNSVARYSRVRALAGCTGLSTWALSTRRATHSSIAKRSSAAGSDCKSIAGALMTLCAPVVLSTAR
jgi:hypothetical protein